MNSKQLAGAMGETVLRVVITLALILAIYQGALVAYDYGYRIFAEPAMTQGEGRTVTVTITEDMKPRDIGELLEENGLVRSAGLFAIQYMVSEYRKEVEPGTYDLNTSMTAEEMMAAMVPAKEETP